MRLGIDMDGVIADFDRAWVDRYNKDFNANIKYKHIEDWDALVTLTHFEDYDQWWNWARNQHYDLFLNALPLPGAVEGVQQLSDDGHDIVIITSKPRWAAGHPGEWLLKHDIPFDELHITDKKSYVICDVYVDDAVHNIEDFLKNTDAIAIQYFAWPYVNVGKEVPGAYYATCWSDVIDIVRQFEKGDSEYVAWSQRRKQIEKVEDETIKRTAKEWAGEICK